MPRRLLIIALGLLGLPRAAFAPSARPTIAGLLFVGVEVSSLADAGHFYGQELGLFSHHDSCLGQMTRCFSLGGQQIGVTEKPREQPDRLQVVGFYTDAAKLHGYLLARGLKPTAITSDQKWVDYFEILDPENHRLAFVSVKGLLGAGGGGLSSSTGPVSQKIIHAGFVVHDRSAMDRFYKDILGFHVYWQGGKKDGETDWVDMQVPDGTDWLEYMLNVPGNASHRTLGVMNHMALGVSDIHAAEKQLRVNGWKGAEEPKIGRDGKWQLNLYDSDDTRVELMEFTPAKEPCCSPYSGPHPGPSK